VMGFPSLSSAVMLSMMPVVAWNGVGLQILTKSPIANCLASVGVVRDHVGLVAGRRVVSVILFAPSWLLPDAMANRWIL
jgi:hypothetical protein